MQEPERHGVMDWIWPILVLFLALGVRSWYLVELTGSGRGTVSLHVQDERPEDLSRELELLAEQKDFFSTPPWSDGPERTAHAAPGHVFFMLGFWKLPPNILLHQAVSWTQCVLGALTALCYCLLARRVFRSQAIAVVAGLLCALHPFWIVNVAELNDGVLASFLLALCLLLGSIGGRSGGAFTSLAFGLLLALLCLVRAALLPFAFVGLLWYLWQCRTVSRSWLSAALVFLGFINGLVPWAVRNFQHFHDVFPVVDSTYYHLWIGNNPQATGGPMPEGPEDFKTQALAQGRDEGPDEVWQEMEQLDQPSR